MKHILILIIILISISCENNTKEKIIFQDIDLRNSIEDVSKILQNKRIDYEFISNTTAKKVQFDIKDILLTVYESIDHDGVIINTTDENVANYLYKIYSSRYKVDSSSIFPNAYYYKDIKLIITSIKSDKHTFTQFFFKYPNKSWLKDGQK